MREQLVREAVWAAARLTDAEALRLPMQPEAFFAPNGWQLYSFQAAQTRLQTDIPPVSDDGFTLHIGGKAVTLYNDRQAPARIRFTLAHELGHLVLRHARRGDLTGAEQEAQADRFAANLLAPAGIAAMVSDAQEAMLLFGLSPIAWGKRLAELAEDLTCLPPACLARQQAAGEGLWRRRCKCCGGVYRREPDQPRCPYCGSRAAERADALPLGLPYPWTAEGWRQVVKNRLPDGIENPMVQPMEEL